MKAIDNDYDLVPMQPIVLHCADCRFASSRNKFAECLCPKQPQWADYEAAQSFRPYSVIREWHCHGDWWEPRLPAPASPLEPYQHLRRFLGRRILPWIIRALCFGLGWLTAWLVN